MIGIELVELVIEFTDMLSAQREVFEMSETRSEQALRNRVERLRPRIDSLIQSGALEKADAADLERRLGEVLRAFEKFAQNPVETESQVAMFEVHVARLETPPSLSQEQEAKALKASNWMLWLSLSVWAILMLSNWLSMLLSTKYNWPFGWFNNDMFVGFALAGVAINVLLTLVPRITRGDWDKKYVGIYAFRVLQATVYSAVIFHFVKDLPATADKCPAVDPNCLTRTTFPFEVTGIFVGMFVHLLEGAFAGIGERFVDMISTLFAQKFVGPRQKAEKNQELRLKLVQLRTRYAEMDKSSIGVTQREIIESIYKDALLLLQGNENDQAEEKLQELELKLASAAQPAVGLTSVAPSEGIQGEEAKVVMLKGQGIQKEATVRLQKDQESIQATDVKMVSETQIRCTFPLKDVALGKWDVVVVNPDLKEYSLSEVFEVKPPAKGPSPPVPSLKLVNIEPNEGVQGEEAKVVILTGQGFQQKVKVKLTLEDQELDPTTEPVVGSETWIRCTFSLKSVKPGKWDVVVINSDSQESSTLPKGFAVKQV